MKNEGQIKETVKQKYSEIALGRNTNQGCCEGVCCTSATYTIQSEDYSQLEGYNTNADMGLGCGLPTKYAGIKKGDTVVDLGSGAGNDCFVALAETGETGKVVGIDFSEAMINKARENTDKVGYTNISFKQGDIENMPLDENFADVIVSNCVLNLLPSKDKIFHEIFRVLKPNGHFCISDVVLTGKLPRTIKNAVEMYVGCISGAVQKEQYITKISDAGFLHVKIAKETPIIIPDEVLGKYLKTNKLEKFKEENPIVSITVTGIKPKSCCCKPGCC